MGESEFKAGVHMPALRTGRGFGAAFFHVEMITADTVKGDLPALGVVELAIAAIIIDPKETDYAQHRQAVKNDIEGETWRHEKKTGTVTQEAQGCKMTFMNLAPSGALRR